MSEPVEPEESEHKERKPRPLTVAGDVYDMAVTLGPEVALRAGIVLGALEGVRSPQARHRAACALRDIIGLLHIEDEIKEP